MELAIKTLTPIWTGGVEAGKVDRIHETGILGSLRWWYEVIVRGLGGETCDPSKGECRFDLEKFEKSQATDERQRLRDAGLCDVCQLFGATGWRRRFRLTIVGENVSDALIEHPVSLNTRQYTDSTGNLRTPTWYFRDPTRKSSDPNTPKAGNFSIRIQSLDPRFPSEVIGGLIQFVADWGAIGARPQMGFGVIELEERCDTQPLYDCLALINGHRTYNNLPSLRNMFLARIAPKSGKPFREQDTFNLKYDLRRLFASNTDLRHFIMGTVKDGRMAAKVKMSRPYNNNQEMRVWGWIPEAAKVYQNSWHREAVVDAIHQHLGSNYTVSIWREMNSPRDTVADNNSNVQAFLRSLLSLEEDDDAA